MSKQKAPPVCCNQPAEFVVNGNSDSLQYYYCRVCKTEPVAISASSSRLCLSIALTFGHNFTRSMPFCRDCGELETAVWDGTHHSWAGGDTPAGTFCMLCHIPFDRYIWLAGHAAPSLDCSGPSASNPSAAPTTSGRPLHSPIFPPRGISPSAAQSPTAPTSVHIWSAAQQMCIHCGITGAEYANYKTSCDDYKASSQGRKSQAVAKVPTKP